MSETISPFAVCEKIKYLLKENIRSCVYDINTEH